MAFVPFVAGQRVTAAELNGNTQQLLVSSTLTVAAGTVTLSVPAGFSRLQVYLSGRSTGAVAVASAKIMLNSDGGANYNFIYTQANNGTVSTADNTGQTSIQVGTFPGASATANYSGSGYFTIDNVNGNGNFFPTIVGTSTGFATTTNMYNGVYTGQWSSTAAITDVDFVMGSGTWAIGSSFSIYGLA